MKVELDCIPAKDGEKPFFAIRLYPDTNKEMADLEWGLSVMGEPEQVVKGFNSIMMYSVCFKNRE